VVEKEAQCRATLSHVMPEKLLGWDPPQCLAGRIPSDSQGLQVGGATEGSWTGELEL
jgi:hypothetical protein